MELQPGFERVFQEFDCHLSFGVELSTADCNHSIRRILAKELPGMISASTSMGPVCLHELN